MKCPQCPESILVMSYRQGVEIDYCPQCRGVWLDRGEIDKLIERSIVAAPAPQQQPYPQPRQDFEHSGYNKSHSGQSNYKRKSWLNELFD